MCNWRTIIDALQISILFFIHTFVLSTLDNTTISIVDFLMVEDDGYQDYPWGQLSFSKLIGSLRHDLMLAKNCIDYMGCRMHLTYEYTNVHPS